MKEEINQKANYDELIQEVLHLKKGTHQDNTSEHISRYLCNLDKKSLLQAESTDQTYILSNFKSNQILLHTSRFINPSVQFINVGKGRNQFVEANISLGFISMKIHILNSHEPSPTCNIPIDAHGQFSEVFFCNFFSKQVAIKLIKFRQEENIKKMIISAVKEYALTKIVSVLGCGPRMVYQLGVELICFSDGIVFFMQKGKKVKKITQAEETTLKSSLSLLHALHIVHNDIKPQNICRFSRDKLVFIDFGFSDVISQARGLKSPSKFKGSLSFCGPEMQQCFLKQEQTMVDLYFNDSQCLVKTIAVIRKQKQEILQLFYLNDIINAQQYFLHLVFKSYIFKGNYAQIRQLLGNFGCFILQNMSKQVLECFSTEYISKSLEKLINEDLSIFQNNELYQKIKEKSRKGHNVWEQGFTVNIDENIIQINNRFTFKQIIYFIDKRMHNMDNCNRMKYFLENYNEKSNDVNLQEYFKGLTKCLTFQNGKSGFSFEDKATVSFLFSQKIMKQEPSSHQLSNIRSCFLFILKHFLSLNKAQYLQIILYLIFENLIVDNSIEDILPQVQDFIDNKATDLADKLLICMKLEEISSFMMFKHRSRDQSAKNNVLAFIFNNIQRFKNKVMMQDKNINSIFGMFHDLSDNKLEDKRLIFKRFSDLLLLVRDKKLFMMMKQVIILGLLSYFLCQFQVNVCILIFQSLFEQLNKIIFFDEKIELKTGIHLMIRFYMRIENYKLVFSMCTDIRKMLDNDEIYNSLQFKWYEWLYDPCCKKKIQKEEFDQFLLTLKNDKYFTFMPQINVWNRIFQNSQFTKQNLDKITAAFYDYFINNFLNKQMIFLKEINQFFLKGVVLMDIIYIFVPTLKQKIKSALCDYTKGIQEDVTRVVINGRSFKYFLIDAILSLKEGRYEHSIVAYRNLLTFSLINNRKESVDYCFYTLILTFYLLKKKTQLFEYAFDYYLFCQKHINFHSYFSYNTGILIFLTLSIFQQLNQQDLLFAILQKFALTITINMNSQYFEGYLRSIKKFDQQRPTVFTFTKLEQAFGRKLHQSMYACLIFYYSFAIIKQKDQSYLLKLLIKIARNVSSLRTNTAQIVLRKLYTGFLRQYPLNGKQKLFIFMRVGHYLQGQDLSEKYRKKLKKKLIRGNPSNQIKRIMLAKINQKRAK